MEFPLNLKPVLRSGAPGQAAGEELPYHPVVVIIDATGKSVLDIGPGLDDLRAGRMERDPNVLVARAVRTVSWLHATHARVAGCVESSSVRDRLILRAYISIQPDGARVIVGARLLVTPELEFDRITREVRLLADDVELSRVLDPLCQRILRRHQDALAMLTSLENAVTAWRVTEQLAVCDGVPLTFSDTRPEAAGAG